MLTFSLDEYGDFEGLKSDNEPIYIAGLIYDDKDSHGEEKTERNRIKAYYKAVIRDAAEGADNSSMFTYPEALHSNGDRSRDHKVVRPVKEMVRNTLSEFISRGTYKGSKLTWVNSKGEVRYCPDREGEYYIFVILKSDAGIKKLLSANANILAKDDYASNLYFHMADELITRLIFYNPLIKNVKDISLDIATRSSGNMKSSDPLVGEYKKQGYKANKSDEDDPNSDVYFSLTNADIYRTVIAEEILDAEKPNISITDFHVMPILYRSYAKKMEFLYMADTICSVLQYKTHGNNADEWLTSIVEKTQQLTGKEENLIFGYDEIDVIYAKAWKKYEEGDFYKALSISFDAYKHKGAFAEYYKNLWFKKLEKRILETKDVSGFNMAVRKLSETLYDNTLDTDKTLYILQVLERLVPTMEKEFHSPEAKGILYHLYDAGVTSYCHIGDSRNAEKYFKKCTEWAGVVSLDEYLNTRNKMVVFCCDYFELDLAEEISDENMLYQELLTDLKKEVHLPGVREGGYTALGKTHSQRAQVYAFKRDSRAEDEFRKALMNFDENSANYKITQSYLLHYYLDTGNKKAYLEEAKDYFGGEYKLADQLKYIINEGSNDDPLINMKYALYIYIRALYWFRLNEMSERVWKDLQTIESKFADKIKKRDWVLSGHPTELIFKYMRLIALSRGEKQLERQYAERMDNCLIYHGVTEDVIRMFGEIEIAHEKGDVDVRDGLSCTLFSFLSENFSIFNALETPLVGEERYIWLCDNVTFMYR